MSKLYETITAKNWGKGDKGFGNPNGPGCIMHHASVGGLFMDRTRPLYTELVAAILALYPDRYSQMDTVAYFNDHPDTTLEDVLRVLKLADV